MHATEIYTEVLNKISYKNMLVILFLYSTKLNFMTKFFC